MTLPRRRVDDEPVEPRHQPLVHVEHPCRERRRLGGPEQMVVGLERRATSRRVHDDRRVARHRGHHPPGQPARSIVEPGVHVERAAAVAAAARNRIRLTDRGHHVGCGTVGLALPRVHHASGEEPHVVTRVNRALGHGATRGAGDRGERARVGRAGRAPAASTRRATAGAARAPRTPAAATAV